MQGCASAQQQVTSAANAPQVHIFLPAVRSKIPMLTLTLSRCCRTKKDASLASAAKLPIYDRVNPTLVPTNATEASGAECKHGGQRWTPPLSRTLSNTYLPFIAVDVDSGERRSALLLGIKFGPLFHSQFPGGRPCCWRRKANGEDGEAIRRDPF